MRYWKSVLTSGLLALCLLVPAALSARAQTSVELAELQLEQADDGLYLSARLRFDLPAAVEDALNKGIAVYFVSSAEVLRERWYWVDKQVASAQRHMRVAYQPLTRRWRLNVSSQPIANSNLAMAFAQHYDTLQEAMASVRRIARWHIATVDELEPGGRQRVQFRFQLDASQLPRTLQIGVIGDADWTLSMERSIDLTQGAGL
ncbi:MAG: DUF4390 domain-containing protein [Burkholderiaceae bacterium]|nr:DUF4390 domain-containing protein [Burkholderiaceae bacterium]